MSSRRDTRAGSRSERLSLPGTWRRLGSEERIAAVGGVLLVVSTFGRFSFVEAIEIALALGLLVLLRRSAQGRPSPLPVGDAAAIAGIGFCAAVLILIRLFERPLGQGLLALGCAGIVAFAGVRGRLRRSRREARKPLEFTDDWAEDEPFA